ncbi:MAG: DNRLRE domain-containing protein [Byssovorax sp.]
MIRRTIARVHDGAANAAQGERGPRARRGVSRAFFGLTALVALGLGSAAGCSDALAPAAESAPERTEEVRQADSAAVICVDLKRAGTLKAYDVHLSKEKPDTNFGPSTFALSGASIGGGPSQFYALFRFPTSTIPPNASVVSATLTLGLVTNGAATANVHLVTAPWDEATVTWSSFGNAFVAQPFKSFSTANSTVVLNVAPQVQAWLDGTAPNHGLLIEQGGAFQTKYKTQEYAVPTQRPVLRLCYKIVCPAGFADCNGDPSDGCEADLATPATCGACGVSCVAPHATAACAAGTCAIGACDLGFADCNGAFADGCETDLTSTASCGACGVVCALPHATTSCLRGPARPAARRRLRLRRRPHQRLRAAVLRRRRPLRQRRRLREPGSPRGICAAPACSDHAQNGSETDVDCGGSCLPCATGLHRASGPDCESAVCAASTCAAPTCADGVKNGGEAAIDCGGPCLPCAAGSSCSAGADCASGVCLGGSCQAPSCADGLKNGGETAVDCGGGCAPCPNGGAARSPPTARARCASQASARSRPAPTA